MITPKHPFGIFPPDSGGTYQMHTSYVQFNSLWASKKGVYKYFKQILPLHFYELWAEKRPKNGDLQSNSNKDNNWSNRFAHYWHSLS